MAQASRSQGFAQHRSTGFADGRQLLECPILRTVLPELPHQETVRQHDQVHVPCLALAVTQLTVSQTQLLLTVPMKGLRSRPAIAIDTQDATHFPSDPIGHEDLTGFRVSSLLPQNHDPHLVVHVRDLHRAGEGPLAFVTTAKFLAVCGRNLGGQRVGLDFHSSLRLVFKSPTSPRGRPDWSRFE